MTRTISDHLNRTVMPCSRPLCGGALISELFNLFRRVSVKSDWRESQSDFREHIESTELCHSEEKRSDNITRFYNRARLQLLIVIM